MASSDQYTGESFELNADLAPLATQQQANAQLIQSLPVSPTGFVGSLNGQTGNVDIDGGTFDGVTFTFTGGAGNVSLSVTGFGSIVTEDQAAAVVNSAVVAGVAYSQTDFQSVIDKLNELLGALRTAGIIAP